MNVTLGLILCNIYYVITCYAPCLRCPTVGVACHQRQWQRSERKGGQPVPTALLHRDPGQEPEGESKKEKERVKGGRERERVREREERQERRERGRGRGRGRGRDRCPPLRMYTRSDRLSKKWINSTTYRFVVHANAYAPMYTLTVDHKHTNHD